MRSTGFDISVKIHGITVSYDDLGPANDQTIIFIHGFPFDKTTWHKQIQPLSSEYRCIAYDIRGFGHSTNDLDELSITCFADDLSDFMEILQINKAIICGLSMGGYIALEAANRYRNLFSGLILCDTQCYGDSSEAKEKRKETIRQIQNNGKKDFADSFIKKIFSDKTLEKNAELTDDTLKIIINTSDDTLVKTLEALANRQDVCDLLKNIDTPSLIICGENDKVTPPELSEYLHKNIKNSELRIIPHAGHLSNLEDPMLFNSLITKFTKSIKLEQKKIPRLVTGVF